jgi:ketosteroid isomerase-like protein
MNLSDKVRNIYAAFSRGDIPAILEHLAPDVEWEYGVTSTEVPWLQPRRGRAEVAEGFRASGAAVQYRKFQNKAILESGNLVVALNDAEFIVIATGRTVSEEDAVNIWHFNESGQVVRFRHRVDTHQQWLACRE